MTFEQWEESHVSMGTIERVKTIFLMESTLRVKVCGTKGGWSETCPHNKGFHCVYASHPFQISIVFQMVLLVKFQSGEPKDNGGHTPVNQQ